jgi:RNA polymerase sigma-70 factor (ECF subfamily)
MVSADGLTNELVRKAAKGSDSAAQELLNTNRERLKRMVAARMDRRLSSRIDSSDVVQEVLAEASQRLPKYLAEQPVPFYPWLRRMALERLIKLHDQHLHVQKRSVAREEQWVPQLSDQSAAILAEHFVAKDSSPSRQAIHQEMRMRVRGAMDQLSRVDREFLFIRYLEQLSIREVAIVLDISLAAAKARHLRALDHLRVILDDNIEDKR